MTDKRIIRKIVRGWLVPETFFNANDLIVYLYAEGYNDLAEKFERLRDADG